MKKFLKHTFIAMFLAIGILPQFSTPVFADAPPVTCDPNTEVLVVPTTGGGSCCPKGSTTPTSCLYNKYINPVIRLLSALVGLAVTIGIIVGAVQFSSSAGDPQKAATGKNHIRNALIALFAYLLFYTFLQFIVPGGSLNAQ